MDLDNDFPSLEQLIPLMPGHVYLIDKEGFYRGCNELQAMNFGLNNRAEVVGKTNKDVPSLQNHPKLIEILDFNNAKVMESGRAFQFEECGLDRDGRLGFFKSHKIPLFDTNKNVIGLLGMSFDISKEKIESDELHRKKSQTERVLSHIISNLPGHVYWVDANNYCLGCNEEQAHVFGLDTKAESFNIDLNSFQNLENAKRIIDNNEPVIEHGETIEEELTLINKEGATRSYLSKKFPLKDKDKKIHGLVSISLDISELKSAQEREKKALEEAINTKIKAQDEIQKAVVSFKKAISDELETRLNTMQAISILLSETLPALLNTYQQFEDSSNKAPLLSQEQIKSLEDLSKNITNATKQLNSALKTTKAST